MVKLFKPYVSWRSRLYALQVLMSGYIGDGDWVVQFEQEFKKKFGFKYFRATSSCTAALDIAYDLVGIGANDEVIVPVLDCTAGQVPLARRKAKIVFADIDKSFNLDPSDVEKRITPKTKAIVFVHFGGKNSNLPEIIQIGRENNIPVIEDAAQAIGSADWGQADITCTSFGAIKTLTSVEGGGIIINNPEFDYKAYRLRWYGFDRKKFQNNNSSDLTYAGIKATMNNLTAAVGLGNLRSIDKVIAHITRLRKIYADNDIESGTWFAGIISENREIIRDALAQAGYESGLHHYRNDLYELFGGKRLDLPFMNEIENKYLLLPLNYYVGIDDVTEICNIVNFYR